MSEESFNVVPSLTQAAHARVETPKKGAGLVDALESTLTVADPCWTRISHTRSDHANASTTSEPPSFGASYAVSFTGSNLHQGHADSSYPRQTATKTPIQAASTCASAESHFPLAYDSAILDHLQEEHSKETVRGACDENLKCAAESKLQSTVLSPSTIGMQLKATSVEPSSSHRTAIQQLASHGGVTPEEPRAGFACHRSSAVDGVRRPDPVKSLHGKSLRVAEVIRPPRAVSTPGPTCGSQHVADARGHTGIGTADCSHQRDGLKMKHASADSDSCRDHVPVMHGASSFSASAKGGSSTHHEPSRSPILPTTTKVRLLD